MILAMGFFKKYFSSEFCVGKNARSRNKEICKMERGGICVWFFKNIHFMQMYEINARSYLLLNSIWIGSIS